MIRLLIIVGAVLAAAGAHGVTKNGFDLSDAAVPAREIHRGGPPRDGIFALTDPDFVTAEAARLDDDERVLGIAFGAVAKAYPIRMLTVHEIVNDALGKQHFAVTYCPLCGSGVVFATNVGESHLNFGVSGLLYNSDVLLYDRNTESLWSQLTGSAIAGKLKGIELPVLPVLHTTWAAWRAEHPGTLVMAGDRRFAEAYRENPYAGYERSRRLYFPVSHEAPAIYHPKETVLGLVIEGEARAYPFAELDKRGEALVRDTLGGREILILWDGDARSARAIDADGRALPATALYWFAWFTFHPDTTVFTAAPGN